MESPKPSPFQNCPFHFDDEHQDLIRQYKAPPNHHPQLRPDPLSRFARMLNVDQQSDRGALRCVAETSQTLQDHCCSLRRIAVQVAHAAAECITHRNAKIPSTSPVIPLIHKSP